MSWLCSGQTDIQIDARANPLPAWDFVKRARKPIASSRFGLLGQTYIQTLYQSANLVICRSMLVRSVCNVRSHYTASCLCRNHVGVHECAGAVQVLCHILFMVSGVRTLSLTNKQGVTVLFIPGSTRASICLDRSDREGSAVAVAIRLRIA